MISARKMITLKRMVERILTINKDLFSQNARNAVVHIAGYVEHSSKNEMWKANASLIAACSLTSEFELLASSDGYGDDAIFWLVNAANIAELDTTYTEWYGASILQVMKCLNEVYELEMQHEQM